jgi:hypothetical protein
MREETNKDQCVITNHYPTPGVPVPNPSWVRDRNGDAKAIWTNPYYKKRVLSAKKRKKIYGTA